MARGRYGRGYRSAGRGTYVTSRRSLPLSNVSHSFPPRRSSFLSDVEDRRTWHPEGASRPARSFTASRHRLGIVGPVSQHKIWNQERPRPFQGVPPGIGFEDARRVLICVRRKIRKQVIHALGVAGKKGLKAPRYGEYSKISCRS